MATFAKKIHIKNSAGTEQTANIYSTTGEAGSPYMHAAVDGATGYVALVSTSASNATSGRVLHTNGTTYAIGSSSVPAYSYRLITSGSGTFTVPSGVSKLRVTCVGGGAGGADLEGENGGTPSSSTPLTTVAIGGGTTTFGSVSANGATNGACYLFSYSYTGTCCNGSRDCSDCTKTARGLKNVQTPAGYHAGWYGYSRGWRDGAAAVPLTNYAGTQIATAGAGGGWDSRNDSNWGYCGASGYRTVSTISVSSGQVISYTVGAGGKTFFQNKYSTGWQGYSGSPSGSVNPGGVGAILVEWGKGIE